MLNNDELFEMWALSVRAKHEYILYKIYERSLYEVEEVKSKPLPSWFKK